MTRSFDLGGNVWFHVLALLVVGVWGTTFISTKVLLLSGLSATDIMLCRFILAYLGICICSRPFKLFANNLRDELLFLLSGVFGGSVYFITENTALQYTQVSNVSLIVCTCPLLTMLSECFLIERCRPAKRLAAGSLMAFAGLAAVIFNGRFVLRLSPAGDLLSFSAAISWTVYTFVQKNLIYKYPSLFVVRKTFFYGILTLIPFLLWKGMLECGTGVLLDTKVLSQLLFLGIIASFLGYMLWNVCLKRIDTIILSNYIFLSPVISIITSNIILGESVNAAIVIGTVFVIAGMVLAGRR